jgi:UDP-N-acetylmuramate--alanine ligase
MSAQEDRRSTHQPPDDGASPLAAAGRKLRSVLGADSGRWLLVDVTAQQLVLVENGAPSRTYAISTAAAGLDGREDSGGTPPGVHTVAQKIGADLPAGAIYRSRRPTGEVWSPPDSRAPAEGPGNAAPVTDDLILSRILTLSGEEEGVNRGPGCDSQARFIYIHGTNHEDRIGEPVSHGCIRLTNRDVIELYDRVEEGDPVVIV